MPKDKDHTGDDEFSLESILAEFGSPTADPEDPETPAPGGFDGWWEQEKEAPPPKEAEPAGPTLPPVKPPEPPRRPPAEPEESPEERDWREDTIPFPRHSPQREDPAPQKPSQSPKKPPSPPKEVPPKAEKAPKDSEGKVLEFPPNQNMTPDKLVAAKLAQLNRRADEFAGHMFEEEGTETDEAVRRAERLIPGVDEEEEAPPPVRERKPKKVQPPPPDVAPDELARRYAKGIKSLRLRAILVFLLLIPAAYLTLSETLPGFADRFVLPLPGPVLRCYLLAGCQGLAMVLGLDTIFEGLMRPFRRCTGMDTVTALANLFVLADALTLPALSGGSVERIPLCLAAALGLWCCMWGSLQKRRGQRLACRTAAAASEPYLVTRDEGKWNNRDTYVKWSGPVTGFGSQVQAPDGAEQIYRRMAPILIIACVLFSLISSLGRERLRDLLWCLGATFTASASLSATLCFGIPWRKLSARLSKSGAALAGWQGMVNTTGSSNLLLSDIDLFPAGSVSLNGVKIFGDWSIEKVVGLTATLIRDSGSGLEKVFHDLLRSQGAIYRRGGELAVYEGGGVSEVIRGEQVLVGSASFMVLMDVALPPGLKVKNAVFCAINGDLAGIFALNYHLPGTVPPALDSLIRNRITPVLATRDFNLIPSMLRQRFKLSVEKLEFPPVARRRELSDPDQSHSDTLTAVLCREGVGPYAEAVVGARRLRSAVRLSTVLACLGSVAGALLSFYLTFVAAYASLTAANLTLFLLMWLVPTLLISGGVDRY